jgi:hypothetical protein
MNKKINIIDDEMQPRNKNEITEAEHELFEKIWHERHLVCIEKEGIESQPKKGLESAKKIRKKYPKELGPYTDYEWGELSGALMAIRWVLGNEWGDLDS